jgi:hypothetical protein
MKIFMLKCLAIAALMSISVLAGMQMANDGIQKLKGSNNSSFQNATSINDKGQDLSASLGNNRTSHDLAAKKKKLEEINSYNIFSSMGKKMADGISSATEKMVDKITK